MAKLVFNNDKGYVLSDHNAELLSNLEVLKKELEYTESVYGVTITINAALIENHEKTQWIDCDIKCYLDAVSYLYVYFDNFPKSDSDICNNSKVYAGHWCLNEEVCLNLNQLAILNSMVNGLKRWRKGKWLS